MSSEDINLRAAKEAATMWARGGEHQQRSVLPDHADVRPHLLLVTRVSVVLVKARGSVSI